MEAVTIKNNEAKNRFEAMVDGHLSVVEYRRVGNKIALTHTEVPAEVGGKGIASKLAKYALEFAREEQLKVLPYCPFIASYIKKHQDYADLVDPKFKG